MLNVENKFPDQFHDCPSLNKRKIRDSRRLLTQKVSLITADEALIKGRNASSRYADSILKIQI